MGKKASAKKKVIDTRGFATTSVPSKKKEEEEEEEAAAKAELETKESSPGAEEQPVGEAGAAASAGGDATGVASKAPGEGEDEDEEDEWERAAELAEAAPRKEAAADASGEGDAEDAGGEGEAFNQEEWARAVEKRFEEELLKLERKANPTDATLSLFERKGGQPPAGVVIIKPAAEQKLDSALAPLRDEEGFVRMTFPRSWRFKGKLTYPRLETIYAALEVLNFKGHQVRWAMQKTLGYDQRAALEMLLVNLPKEELPRQFGGEGMGDQETALVAAEMPDAPDLPEPPSNKGKGGGKDGQKGRQEGNGKVAEAVDGLADEQGLEGGEEAEESGKLAEASAADAADSAAAPESVAEGDVDEAEDGLADVQGPEGSEEAEESGKLAEVSAAVAADSAAAPEDLAEDFNKRWLQQYAENSGSESDDQLLNAEEKLERERKADPTARYIKVAKEVEDLSRICKNLKDKKRTGAFKQNISADQQKQRDATTKLAKFQVELKDLDAEKYGTLDRERITLIQSQQKGSGRGGGGGKGSSGKGRGGANGAEAKTPSEPAKEKVAGEEEDEAGEELPSLFDGNAPDPTEVVPGEPEKPIRQYNIAGWGGRTPRQNLEEHMRQRVWGKKNAPNIVAEYKKVPGSAPGRYRSRVTVILPRQQGTKTFDPEEACDTARDADNLAAAWSLFKLVEEDQRDGLRRNMPPTFRSRWQEWTKEAADRMKEAQKDFVRKKIEFLERCCRTKPPPPVGPVLSQWEAAATKAPAEWGEESGVLQETKGDAAAKLRSEFRARQQALKQDEAFMAIQQCRDALPVAGWREPLLRALQNKGALVVSGATGSGKTTQVPQFVLEHALEQKLGDPLPNIIVTEPRRISAVSVAKRVSQEMGDPAGGPGSRNSLVGYQIRMEKKVSSSTRLLFCTVGVLLRQLQTGVSALSKVTHIFIDEVHERSADCDLLILLLRQILKQHRTDLRVVLMSATLEVEKITRYFGGAVPSLAIPGRTFPVETFWLEDVVQMSGYRCEEDSEFAKKWWGQSRTRKETFQVSGQAGKKETLTAYIDDEDDWVNDDEAELCDPEHYKAETQKQLSMMDHSKINFDLIEETMQLIEESPRFQHVPRDEGAILVFLPGLMEITKVADRLGRHPIFGDPSRAIVISLHSVLSGDDQSKAFERPRRGVRKVVLSTNIAETGVTIPDCVFVIDAGKVKSQSYQESTNTSSLKEQFISRAEVLQRRGRAGRVREGFAFHLLTASRFDRRFQEMPTPEILRCSLMELMLQVLSSGLQPGCFSEALDPPPKARIDQAVATLKATGAVEESQRPANAPQWGIQDDAWYVPTPLGLCLSRLPCDLRLGKIALFGALFGGNEACWTVAATLSHRSPLATPFTDQKRALAKSTHCAELLPKDMPASDHFALNTAYNHWDDARKTRHTDSYCKKSFIDNRVMQTIRDLRTDLLDSLRTDGYIEQYPKEELTKQETNSSQVTAALLFAGLYPNVARVDAPRNANDKSFMIWAGNEQLRLHPGSLCHGKVEALHRTNHRWACYHTKMKTSQVFLRDCTFLTPNALLLFGGDTGALSIHPGERCVALGSTSERHWHCLYLAPRHAAAIRQLRFAFDSLLRRKALDPKRPLSVEDRAVIVAYVSILGCVEAEV
mmetsp:Transcript_67792/g.220704  ORF Transcript_67792/g.220704 Transcript_67792/m.220704 type:complete len:1639 (+) Transcript_67792:67-4983(+)